MSFGDLSFDVDSKAATGIALDSLHLAQPALVAFEHLCLVRNRDLHVHNDGKIQTDQLSQDSRECRIRQLFQTHEGIKHAVDVQIGIGLVRNTDVDQLLAGALILQLFSTSPVRPLIRKNRIQRSLGFPKQVIVGQPPACEVRRVEPRLHSTQQAFKLRSQLLVLVGTALNALVR